MSSTDEFMKCCSKILKANFGPLSDGIIKKAQSKKNLIETSNINDFEEFIDFIEYSASAISGKYNAGNICKPLRTKAIELAMNDEAMEMFNSLNKEVLELNIKDLLARINAIDMFTLVTGGTEMTGEQESPGISISNRIEEFLKENTLPGEGEITRYATDLALEYGGEAKKVRKDIIEKVKFRVKDSLCRKAIKEEINRFLTRYMEPARTDIDDFIRYIRLLNLNFQEDEIRQQIEKERLYRKFQEPQYIEITPEFTQLVDIMKTYNDDKDISNALQDQELGYLIEDESGISDKLLYEIVELLMLIERDSLQGLYLKRMVKRTHFRT